MFKMQIQFLLIKYTSISMAKKIIHVFSHGLWARHPGTDWLGSQSPRASHKAAERQLGWRRLRAQLKK